MCRRTSNSARLALERLRVIVWYDRAKTNDPRAMSPELFARYYLLNFPGPS